MANSNADFTRTNDYQIAHLNFDGTNPVVIGGTAITPSGSVYALTNGASAYKITIAEGVRIRGSNCILRAEIFDMKANSRVDADGNADGTTTSLNHTAGDLFLAVATGGAQRTTTGVGTAGIGSGGNSMGSSAGAVGAAGAQLGNTTASTTTMSVDRRNHFRSRDFLHLYRSQGNPNNFLVTGGQGGCGGSVDISAGGTATGPAGGSAGQCLVIRARDLIMAAGARISARGGDGTAASSTGAGIASGSSPGGGGWVWVDCHTLSADATAVIDAYSGSTGAGANGGATSYLAPAGSVVVWIGGRPAPRRRVCFSGDSKVVGFGTTATVQQGGYRTAALDKKYYGNVPWRPVGGQLNGAFPNNEIVGASGEKVSQTAARFATDAATYIANIPGWPHPVVVLDTATNDVTSGVPAEATSVSQYSGMLDTIFTANANAIVFVCTLIDHQTAGAAITSYNTALTTMVTARAEYAAGNLKIIDLRAALGAWSATTYVDTTHANEAGHLLLAAAIKTAFTNAGL